jgi:hypothetical protein
VLFTFFYLLFIPYASSIIGQIVESFLLSSVLVIAGLSIKKSEKFLSLIILLVIFVDVFFVWLFIVQSNSLIEAITRGLTSVSFAFVAGLIFTDLLKVTYRKTVGSDFIWGGVATYLLIGLTFASVYRLVELYTPGSFSSSSTPPSYDFSNFIYYSYYALTTIDGLMTPNTLQAQSLVMLEPVMGTLFIAILISRLVSIARKD